MTKKNVEDRLSIYKLKTSKEILDYYKDWTDNNKYNQDMVDMNYTAPKETVAVLVNYTFQKGGRKVEKEIGKNSYFIQLDVSSKESMDNFVKNFNKKFSKLDILINNAAKDPKVKKGGGLTPDSRFETMTEDYWQEGIDAALNGTFLCSQVVSNKMLENDYNDFYKKNTENIEMFFFYVNRENELESINKINYIKNFLK